jgi:Cu(I)/Ag(I) efflux system membrane protein CusA/SilA
MLAKLIRFCVQQPWLVALLTVATAAAGWWSYSQIPIDAIPNVGENQVIVVTSWPGRSPRDVEDQVTYPLSATLSAVSGADSVRGKSLFGYSFVQVTFKDDVGFDWARTRVLEQLATVGDQLPEGVAPQLGPDATALGQIYYYVLVPPGSGMSLAELRSVQDFVVKYDLQSVEGVAEVASIGGYVREYQVEANPDKLRHFGVSLDTLLTAIRQANVDVGAKTVERSGMEFIVRSEGRLGQSAANGDDRADVISDLERVVVVERGGVPVRVRDLAFVHSGPQFRRGALDHNGSEAVGGVVVMRHGENPREVISRVKDKIIQLESGLGGIEIKGVYDRTGLIDETVGTLSTALRDEIIITALVIVLFLLHFRSSLIVALTLPVAVLITFIAMRQLDVDANIMSLAGIAIAIGTMVDMSIIVTENVFQHLAQWKQDEDQRSRDKVIIDAATEVAPAVITAVSTTVISFLPVFFLTGRDAKLFTPLATTKTLAILAALVVAVVVVPMLCRLILKKADLPRPAALLSAIALALLATATSRFLWGVDVAEHVGLPAVAVHLIAGLLGFAAGWMLAREQLRPAEENLVSRLTLSVYVPVLRFFLARKGTFFVIPSLIVVAGLVSWIGLPTVVRPFERGAEWLGLQPDELPGYVSLKHTVNGLETDDWIALDEGSWFYMPTLYPAASFDQAMRVLQTQDVRIRRIPEVADVLGKIGRVDSALDPAPVSMIETYVMLKPRDQWRDGITGRDIWDQINKVATLPGVTPASPLQPIEGRVVMLQSGIKASMAIRIHGDRLDGLAEAARQVATRLKQSPLVNPDSVNPDIVLGKPYAEFSVNRDAASRYGMNTAEVNRIIESAIGGMQVTETIEGRERYPVLVRYQRGRYADLDQLRRIPVVTGKGQVVPLEQLASFETRWGPGAISSEDARLVAHVSFSTSGVTGDLESVSAIETSLRNAQSLSAEDPNALNLPPGYSIEAVGSFRNQIEANRRLTWLIPIVIGINLIVIYLQFRRVPITLAVFTGIPVAFGGGMILLALMGTEINTATWVGFIALFGIAIDDGVVMATYLNQVFLGHRQSNIDEIRDAVVQAGSRRIRPCLMTTATTLFALLPVLVADGRGADVARAMALPIVGGMAVELVTLFVVPVAYCGLLETKFNLGFDLPNPDDE